MLVAVLVLILLAASAYLGIAAVANRRTVQGEAFLSYETYSDALQMFKKAEKYNKYILRKKPRITEGMAESHFGLEDFASALEYYTLTVNAEPNNAKAIYRIGLIYIDNNNCEKALEQIKALRAIDTGEALEYAETLTELMRENVIKGLFQDIFDRLTPGQHKNPKPNDGPDSLEEKPAPDSGTETESRNFRGPDSTGAGATI